MKISKWTSISGTTRDMIQILMWIVGFAKKKSSKTSHKLYEIRFKEMQKENHQ